MVTMYENTAKTFPASWLYANLHQGLNGAHLTGFKATRRKKRPARNFVINFLVARMTPNPYGFLRCSEFPCWVFHPLTHGISSGVSKIAYDFVWNPPYRCSDDFLYFFVLLISVCFAVAIKIMSTMPLCQIYTDDGNNGPWSIDTITDTTQRTFTKCAKPPKRGDVFKILDWGWYHSNSGTTISSIEHEYTFFGCETIKHPNHWSIFKPAKTSFVQIELWGGTVWALVCPIVSRFRPCFFLEMDGWKIFLSLGFFHFENMILKWYMG